MISVVAALCLVAFSLQGMARGNSHGHSHNGDGGVISWFDGL
jgi:hypothetical protein